MQKRIRERASVTATGLACLAAAGSGASASAKPLGGQPVELERLSPSDGATGLCVSGLDGDGIPDIAAYRERGAVTIVPDRHGEP